MDVLTLFKMLKAENEDDNIKTRSYFLTSVACLFYKKKHGRPPSRSENVSITPTPGEVFKLINRTTEFIPDRREEAFGLTDQEKADEEMTTYVHVPTGIKFTNGDMPGIGNVNVIMFPEEGDCYISTTEGFAPIEFTTWFSVETFFKLHGLPEKQQQEEEDVRPQGESLHRWRRALRYAAELPTLPEALAEDADEID